MQSTTPAGPSAAAGACSWRAFDATRIDGHQSHKARKTKARKTEARKTEARKTEARKTEVAKTEFSPAIENSASP